jgi:hypothetical protein
MQTYTITLTLAPQLQVKSSRHLDRIWSPSSMSPSGKSTCATPSTWGTCDGMGWWPWTFGLCYS